METLLVRELRLMKDPTFNSGPQVLESHRISKKVDLPGIPPDGLVLQDAHMCMAVDGAVYDLVNKSLLVRIRPETVYTKEKLQGALMAYQVLGWFPFPHPENKEVPDGGGNEE